MFADLHHFKVQSSYKLKIPSSFIIPSSNLKLGSTLGQGELIRYQTLFVSIIAQSEVPDDIFFLILGEFGVVYKGYLKRGVSETVNATVAVKTLKGIIFLLALFSVTLLYNSKHF